MDGLFSSQKGNSFSLSSAKCANTVLPLPMNSSRAFHLPEGLHTQADWRSANTVTAHVHTQAGGTRSHRTKARNWTSSNSNLLTSRSGMLSYWMLLFMNSPRNLLADHCIWRIFLYVDYWEVETVSCSRMRPGSHKLLGCLLPPLTTPQTKSPPRMHREVPPSIHRLTDAPLPTHIFCVFI